MFSLFYGLFHYLFQKKEYYILILGLDSAGKTTLLERLKNIYSGAKPLPPEKIFPTVGLNVGKLDTSDVRLLLWDLGGQSSLRVIWEKYYSEASAIIYVVDSSNVNSFHESKQTIEKVLQSSELNSLPVLFFANKQDLSSSNQITLLQSLLCNGGGDENFDIETKTRVRNRSDDQREIHTQENRPTKFVPICALNGDGVTEGMNWLVLQLKTGKYDRVISE